MPGLISSEFPQILNGSSSKKSTVLSSTQTFQSHKEECKVQSSKWGKKLNAVDSAKLRSFMYRVYREETIIK